MANAFQENGYVVVRSPMRISLAGGGTDLPSYYERNGYGQVINTAIDKYVYITLKKHSEFFDEPIRLNYSETELRQTVDEIRNNITRACLRLLNVDEPVYIGTVGDVPAGTGLGSSSSFAVGLLYALHVARGEHVSAGQIAEEACQVELRLLEKPIGKQDQYAAAYGGLNLIEFQKSGATSVTALNVARPTLDTLFSRLMLVWTGVMRPADDILTEQNSRTVSGKVSGELDSLLDMVGTVRRVLEQDGDLDTIGHMIGESWERKRRLSARISSGPIEDIIDRALKAGALGGKVCGAGGGGFVLLYVREENREKVRVAIKPYATSDVYPDFAGVTNLFPMR